MIAELRGFHRHRIGLYEPILHTVRGRSRFHPSVAGI